MSAGRADVTLAGRGARTWIERHPPTGDPADHRFGHLGLVSAGIHDFARSDVRLEFVVLGPADPINSLEMAQVIVEQIAALPDAELLAQDSIELRILRP